MTVTTLPTPPRGLPTSEAGMARAAHENFPVAGLLVGRRRAHHLLAIYGYARFVDDVGDEADGDRSALLDWVEADLDRLYSGHEPEHPVLRALAPTVRELNLPDGPLRRLIEANRRDQVTERYPTFASLLEYCTFSAAPVGELVLHVFGAATPDRIALSDSVCAGLQVVEHLQDVAEDLRDHGRVYLPLEDLERFGCPIEDLSAPSASRRLRDLMAFEVQRAHALLAEGAPLIRRLDLRGGLAVAGFVAGGRTALDAIERAGYDVLSTSPRPGKAAFAAALTRTILQRR